MLPSRRSDRGVPRLSVGVSGKLPEICQPDPLICPSGFVLQNAGVDFGVTVLDPEWPDANSFRRHSRDAELSIENDTFRDLFLWKETEVEGSFLFHSPS